MYMQWYYHKWGKTFLSDFQCWPKEGWIPQHGAAEPLEKTMSGWERPNSPPFPFYFFPASPCPLPINHPDHTAGAASDLLFSELPLLHLYILYWTRTPRNSPVEGGIFIIWPFLGGQGLRHSLARLLPQLSEPVSDAGGLHPQQEAQLRRNPLPAHSTAFWSSPLPLAALWYGSSILTVY